MIPLFKLPASVKPLAILIGIAFVSMGFIGNGIDGAFISFGYFIAFSAGAYSFWVIAKFGHHSLKVFLRSTEPSLK